MCWMSSLACCSPFVGSHPRCALNFMPSGSVVPVGSMLALSLGTGPSGVALDLPHAARSTARVLDELLGLLLGVCRVTPQVQARALYLQGV